MAEDKKKKRRPVLVTPAGKWIWVWLTEPSFGSEKFPNPGGSFKVTAVYKTDSREANELIAKLQPYYEEALAIAEEKFAALPKKERDKLEKVRAEPFYEVLVDENDEPTGEIGFKFTMKHTRKSKRNKNETYKVRPVIWDAKRNAVNPVPPIGSGTIGRIAFNAGDWFVASTGLAGLKLYLTEAQILDLKGYGGSDGSAFGTEEGGYEFKEPRQTERSDVDADEDADEDEDYGNF